MDWLSPDSAELKTILECVVNFPSEDFVFFSFLLEGVWSCNCVKLLELKARSVFHLFPSSGA